MRQSRPDSGLGLQVTALKTSQIVPSSLASVNLNHFSWFRTFGGNATVRERAWNMFLDAPVLTVDVTFLLVQDKISKSLVSLVFGANHLGDQLPAAMAPLEDYLKTVRRRCAVIICFCPCSFFLSSVCFIFSIAREPIDATPEDHFEDQVSAAMALLEDFLSVQSV